MGSRPEHWRQELIVLFEAICAHLKTPLTITSGWRCPRHNHLIHGSKTSLHCIGAALDISCPKLEFDAFAAAAEFAARLSTHGQAGVGYYPKKRFVHIDLGLGRCPGRRWTD